MKGDYRICLIFLVSILTSWIKIVRSLLFKCLKDGGWVREFCDAQEVKHWFQKNLKKLISKPLLMNRYLPWSWLLSRIPASLSTVASIVSNQAQIRCLSTFCIHYYFLTKIGRKWWMATTTKTRTIFYRTRTSIEKELWPENGHSLSW